MSTTTTKRAPDVLPEYNGWHNYPTWCVNLWLTNDQGLDERLTEMVDDVISTTEEARKIEGTSIVRELRHILADNLKAWVEEDLCDASPDGFQGDLMGWALAYVSWDELAEHYIADHASAKGET